MQSVLARGARRSKARFGSAVDLFAQGHAELHLRDGRDLQTLAAFDVTHARPAIADDLNRFTGASALAEIMLRFAAADDAHPQLFDVLAASLDRIERAAPASRHRGRARLRLAPARRARLRTVARDVFQPVTP